MADDRPVEDTTDQVARLQRELDDLKSTVFARLSRKSTGDIEITLRPTPKEGTLFLAGQTLSRATYPDLWQWVTANNMVIEDAFGPGDGSTTFRMPDMRGRVPIGAGTIDQGAITSGGNGLETYYIGRSGGLTQRYIGWNSLPAHAHSIGDNGDHFHGIFNTTLGDHSGHNNSSHSVWVASNATGQTTIVPNDYFASWGGGPHNHTMNTEGQHNHTCGSVGGDSGFSAGAYPLDMRQPYMTINWMIWT